MFDKFSPSALQAVFHARGQASLFGTEIMTPELLLLAILRWHALDVSSLIGNKSDRNEELRKQIEEQIPRGETFSTSVDLPISKELELVFQHAIEEVSGTEYKIVQLGHLLIGVLREEGCCAAQVLRANGAELELVRQRMLKSE